MPITTASAKQKGRKLQQTVSAAILEAFPSLTPDDVRSCPMGSQGVDVQLSQAAKAAFPFNIECKARKAIALLYEALEQADRHDGLTALAIVKADRKRPLVVIDLDDFMKLVAGD